MARLPLGSRRINIESAGVEILKKYKTRNFRKTRMANFVVVRKLNLHARHLIRSIESNGYGKPEILFFFQISFHKTYLTFQLGYVSLSKVYQGEEWNGCDYLMIFNRLSDSGWLSPL